MSECVISSNINNKVLSGWFFNILTKIYIAYTNSAKGVWKPHIVIYVHAECPAVPVSRRHLSRNRRGHRPHINAMRQPIRAVVYPRVLNQQRRAARQLLFVIDNAGSSIYACAYVLCFIRKSRDEKLKQGFLSKIKHFFSTRSLRSLTECRNAPGRPVCLWLALANPGTMHQNWKPPVFETSMENTPTLKHKWFKMITSLWNTKRRHIGYFFPSCLKVIDNGTKNSMYF
jgi:hypothetical protein